MFKEMEDRDDCFVFHNKNGHEVKVAKKGLSPAMMKKIQGFAKGGEVKKPEAPVSQESAQKFAQGYNSQTIEKPKNYAYGDVVQDPTLGLTEPAQMYSEAPQAIAQPAIPLSPDGLENPQGDIDRAPQGLVSGIGNAIGKYGVAPVINAFKDASNAYGRVAGGVGDAIGSVAEGAGMKSPVRAEGQGNPNVKPAAIMQGASSPELQNVSLGEAVPRGTEMIVPQGLGGGIDPYKTMGQLVSNTQKEAQIQGELGRQQAGLYEQEANKHQALLANYEEQQKHLTDEYEAIKADVASGEINPNRYFENMGTFGKVRTAIGMVIAGLGAGLTKQENPAIKFLNAQIDRDIDAQKANLGKKENLLSANLRQYGNLKDAMTATKMAYTGMIEAQMNKLVANAKSPLAQANAEKAVATLRLQMAQPLQEMAMRQAALRGLQSQNGLRQASMKKGGPDELERVNQLIEHVVPEHERKKATEEIEMLRNYKNGSAEISKIYDEMKQLGASAAIPFSTKAATYNSLKARLYQAARQGMKGQGTLSDQEVNQAVSPLVPNKLDSLNVGRIDAMKNAMLGIVGNGVQKGAPTLTRYFQRFGFNPMTEPSNAKRLNSGPGFQRASMKR